MYQALFVLAALDFSAQVSQLKSFFLLFSFSSCFLFFCSLWVTRGLFLIYRDVTYRWEAKAASAEMISYTSFLFIFWTFWSSFAIVSLIFIVHERKLNRSIQVAKDFWVRFLANIFPVLWLVLVMVVLLFYSRLKSILFLQEDYCETECGVVELLSSAWSSSALIGCIGYLWVPVVGKWVII